MASIQGWGRETWNSGAWSQQAPVSVTGIGLTSSVGTETVTTDQNISVSGNPLTSTAGTTVATGIANAIITNGASATSARGDVSLSTDQNISVSGNPLTSTVGDESTSVTSTTGWNRDTDVNTGSSIGWSEQQWGAVGGSFAVTGQPMTSSTGDESIASDQNISVSGNPLTSTTGTFAVSGDGQTTVVVGADTAMQSTVGTVEADPEFVVFPTGNAMTSTVGTVGTSVFVTGIGMTSTIGDAEQETLYEAPSVEAESDVGTLNIRTDVVFTITGVSATSSAGTLQGTFWSQVDDSNSGISWTEVHKAA